MNECVHFARRRDKNRYGRNTKTIRYILKFMVVPCTTKEVSSVHATEFYIVFLFLELLANTNETKPFWKSKKTKSNSFCLEGFFPEPKVDERGKTLPISWGLETVQQECFWNAFSFNGIKTILSSNRCIDWAPFYWRSTIYQPQRIWMV